MIETNPHLIGSVVYFSPTKKADLECIIRDDGTISASTNMALRFNSVSKLAESWKNGEVTAVNGTKFPRVKISATNFGNYFFFKMGRQGIVKKVLPVSTISTTETSSFNDEQMDSIDPIEPALSEMHHQQPFQATAATENTGAILDAPSIFLNDQSPSPSLASTPKTKQCPGLDRLHHQVALSLQQWNGARSEFSPVRLDGDRCWSKTCRGEISSNLSLCWGCKQARQRLWAAKTLIKRQTNEKIRIRHTPNRWLTKDEKLKKSAFVLAKLQARLMQKSKETKRLKGQLRMYRPQKVDNRKAVRSVVKKLGSEQKKVEEPVCQWRLDGDQLCEYRGDSIIALIRHIREAHYGPQLEANKTCSLLESREYYCHWKGCKRRAPFRKFQYLRRHVLMHTGSAKTEQTLAIGREQMINWTRAPTGRRYSQKTKQVILQQHKSRSIHEKSRNLSLLPLPSTQSVMKWKNRGGIKSGIDWTVLEIMEKIGEKAKNLCHGLLTFDEVSYTF